MPHMLNSLSIYYLLDKLSQVTRRVVSPLGKDNPKRFLNKVATLIKSKAKAKKL